jgi:hypothetical protein
MTHKPENRADVLTEHTDKLLCQTHSDVSHAQMVLLLTQETQQSVIAQLVNNWIRDLENVSAKIRDKDKPSWTHHSDVKTAQWVKLSIQEM